MPSQYTGGNDQPTARTWATQLTNSIQSGAYKSQASSWLSGMDINDPEGSAIHWAQDANAYVCSNALKGGESAVENKELSGTYYNNAVPVFNMQIAKGGYRLAAWLNLIVTGSTGLN